jgi:putative protease
MELLAPAGNIEKLQYAYEYGADAAYIGLKRFSLRVKADNFYENEYEQIQALKAKYPEKRLHCALNISFHNKDIDHFLREIDYFKAYPIDAFIVQDLGITRILQKHFPNTELHVSTQASCINRESVKMYRDIGFSRVVLGREASLAEVKEIKDAVPEMEIEVFAHGAMCIAYAGRCLMSAYMTGRSANSGFCSHSCRWDYKLLAKSGNLLLEEKARPGEYFPVFEGDDYTAILSSKDLCMVDHLDDMKAAGVDSLKIEGRMKSLYYVALTTRAYRKALDALDGKISPEEAKPFVDELYKAKHREFGTGFFYSREDADKTTMGESDSEYDMVATIGKLVANPENVFAKSAEVVNTFQKELDAMHPDAKKAKERDLADHPEKVPHSLVKKEGYRLFEYVPLNKVDAGTELEYVGPENIGIKDNESYFVDTENCLLQDWVSHGGSYYLYTNKAIEENWIVRVKDPEYVEGQIRSTGR